MKIGYNLSSVGWRQNRDMVLRFAISGYLTKYSSQYQHKMLTEKGQLFKLTL